ncbi:DMT family transporter [Brachyspira innocens]|uniref:DMT family transporter n=1 Tax=Brachyspira innocens TaxID=13264 RepID=A0ABT8YTX9_9SPIR|nr:DMT family transporter [Brachyspira innocens]MDO6993435.1 DMT family transporter [Brachyspira innocens]MDO7019283.1 DMT family transporter [Brachyspira innocens]
MGIFLLIGVMALSASAIFVKLANAPSSIMAFYRIFISFWFIFIITMSKKTTREEIFSLTKKEIILGLISGVSLALHYFLWFHSLNLTSVASATVIVTLQPLFAFVAGYFFFKERYTKLAVSGFIIAVIGSVIIGWGDFQLSGKALIGDLLSFISAGFISNYFIIGQYTRRRLSAFSWISLTYFFAFVFLGILSYIMHIPFTGYSTKTWFNILGLTLISTMLGQMVFTWLLKYFSATVISMTILGEAVGTCILGYFILHETVSLQQFVGIIVILLGIGIFLWEKRKTIS